MLFKTAHANLDQKLQSTQSLPAPTLHQGAMNSQKLRSYDQFLFRNKLSLDSKGEALWTVQLLSSTNISILILILILILLILLHIISYLAVLPLQIPRDPPSCSINRLRGVGSFLSVLHPSVSDANSWWLRGVLLGLHELLHAFWRVCCL